MALMEETVLDPHNGRLVVRNLADYHVPVHADIDNIEVLFTDKPDPHISPLGVRGVGEIGITGVAAAIALCSVPRNRKAHPGPTDYARQTAVDNFILHESSKC